ncbi:MAG: type IV toxin-antitoxin system AbiEi family antitoxin domain-containing protein [Clostridia bacterium]|nr:type IV toxin-antitoxin system AbiEi family antitoxin domain-containing protein [Clostridia bacterium]
MTKLEKYIDESGIIRTSDILSNGISKYDYYRYLKENNYEKISHGMYAKADMWSDELAIIKKRCPQAVISHDEALYYHGLIDHEPERPTFTIYSGYNTSRLKSKGYKAYYVKKDYLDLGKIAVKDFNGNEVYMYDLERTMCDLVRNRNSFESQDFTTALKSYARRSDKNLTRLFEYAEIFRIDRLLRQYLEVLL